MITITGNLKNVFGALDAGAGLRVTLNGYGANMPRVIGTGIIVNPDVQVTMPGDGTFSFTVNGNDIITPGPNTTFYSIAFQPSSGGTVKTLNYQFSGSGTFDLSTLSPMVALPATVPPVSPVVTNPTGLQVISAFALMTRLAFSPNAVASSATPIFDVQGGSSIRFTMNQNVSSSTLINSVDGEFAILAIKQDPTGNWTFAFPANVTGAVAPDPTPNVTTYYLLHRIGANFIVLAAGTF